MDTYKLDFIELALSYSALKFGTFSLKSGRVSPYFFNIAHLHDGLALKRLGEYYAKTIAQTGIVYDMLFGPAYKGIPLVCTTAIALTHQQQKNIPYCFNRKETKDHGEGGELIGAPLNGKVIILDDVITAGTAITSSMGYLTQHHASLAGIIVALDRQEIGQTPLSACQELAQTYQVAVTSIITLQDLIYYLSQDNRHQPELQAMREYQQKYGTIS